MLALEGDEPRADARVLSYVAPSYRFVVSKDVTINLSRIAPDPTLRVHSRLISPLRAHLFDIVTRD
jgi:hypothetical protein